MLRLLLLLLAVEPPAQADLALTLTDAPDPAVVSQDVVFTVTVRNLGPQPAAPAHVMAALPAELELQSLQTQTGTCSLDAPSACDLGVLSAGAQVAITLVARPNAPGTFATTASVSSDTADPQPENNHAEAQTRVQPAAEAADLQLSQVTDATTVRADTQVRFTIALTNAGPAEAPNVVLTDTLPIAAEFISAATTPGGCAHVLEGVVTCQLGALPAGANARIDVVLIPTTEGTNLNEVTVTSSAADPNHDNNRSIAAVTLEEPPPYGFSCPFCGATIPHPAIALAAALLALRALHRPAKRQHQ